MAKLPKDKFEDVLGSNLCLRLRTTHIYRPNVTGRHNPVGVGSETSGVLFVDIANYRFNIDVIDGMYSTSEDDEYDTFDYYNGELTHTPDGDEYVLDINSKTTPWYGIKEVEIDIDFIYKNTILRMLRENSRPVRYNPNNYVTREMVDAVKSAYVKNLEHIFRIENTESAEVYRVDAFPNYVDNWGVVLYTQIGYPVSNDTKEPVDCSDKRFFLTINFGISDDGKPEWECLYSEEFPWVSNQVNLYSPIPGDIKEYPIFKSALQLAVNDTMCDLNNVVGTGEDQLWFVDNPNNMGFLTPGDNGAVFVNALDQQIQKNYPKTAKAPVTSVKFHNFNSGITRVIIGSLIVDVAVSTCGLVDMALDHDINKDETWDDIFYKNITVPTELLYSNERLDEMGFIVYNKANTESRIIMEDIGNIIMEIMYRTDKIVDATK